MFVVDTNRADEKLQIMKHILQVFFLGIIFSNSAIAGGTHGGVYDHLKEIGKPGTEQINRSFTVKMLETEDGMIFKPDFLKFHAEQTVKIKLINEGKLQHEFVMDTKEAILKHKLEMEDTPDMEHGDPNSLRLNPNEMGEILWTFSKSGTFTFACLIPGHYEAGMHGELLIN
ncbi:MAG: plastocyanin/azurin family copper-binding protein [Paracoccaceae bacterium]|nr:plastocyanin/azurin family copper-binding protein [Paracoccaceae bacterium]